jgi:hypothetical protein
MPRVKIPISERKTPYGVSLTRPQREKLQALGGSPWLQGVIDATPDPRDADLVRLCQSMTTTTAHRARSKR